MRIVLSFMSSKPFTPSCAISTCGSFWNIAATVTTGRPPSRTCIVCRSLEPMTQSAWPAAMIW